MIMEDLKDKAILFQGKKYVLVADRIIAFNKEFPKGSIKTTLISAVDSNQIIVKATVKPDCESFRAFTGYSQAIVGGKGANKDSALENCETSAVGSALAMMGIGVLDSVASLDEMTKADNAAKSPISAKPPV